MPDTTHDDLVKRLRDLGDHASFEPHMHHTAADRIEELEALYEAAKHDAQEAEAYAEALEAKLYDIAQEELKPKGRGPWPNAIRAVNYRIGTNEDGTVIQAHRIEQYHEGRWTAIRVFNESEDGTLEEEDQ
jgi:hypothetical protein